ncbi:hypothetical protein BKA66DRAFT_572747 [Pyrenochaeta sp. MPI-SDFR-AT-0127]|nr:hypothetical protein BKA66DRAFT_572747 [Pyrenochaeta sp. MPI-SDFR-AT-0127]
MSSGLAKPLPEQDVAPLNFIYACCICCASFADVYEGCNETVCGLSDGINTKERLVSKMFLANCCHVFCAEHLEGGGEFRDTRPRASCPVCIKEKNDTELRDLYSIRGFSKDEYDPQIPPNWFTAPPIKLDGNGKEMEALRFQYIALIRYCQNTYATRKPLQTALAEARKELSGMQDRALAEHSRFLILEQENDQLRCKQDEFNAMKAEVKHLQEFKQEAEQYRNLNVNPRDLETFITHKAEIRHYLKLVPMLLEQNEKMKARLASLGFAMALEPVPNFKGLDADAFDEEFVQGDYEGESGALSRKTASSQTAGRSIHTSARAAARPSSPHPQRPSKRQRLNSPLLIDTHASRLTSQNTMPPPPKPVSRKRSVRDIFPTLRKKLHYNRSTPTPERDVQVYESRTWQTGEDDRFSTRKGFQSYSSYVPDMHSIEQPMQSEEQRDNQRLSSIDISDRPNISFRSSSPIKLNEQSNGHQPVQLPTEPSYIRLLDGLSQDQGIELGLKDPRDGRTRGSYHDNVNRQVVNVHQGLYQRRELKSLDGGNPGYLFPFKPHNQSLSTDGNLNPYRSNQANGYINRAYQPNIGPFTPAPRQYQPSGHQIENVFKSFRRLSVTNIQGDGTTSRLV